MRFASSSWIPLALAFALLGCGNSAGGDAGTGDGASLDAGDAGRADAGDTSCATLARSYCQHVTDCTQGIGIDELYGNVAACEMRVAQLCMRAMSAPGASVTPEQNITCAAGITSSTCPVFFADRVPECVHTGSRADGMSCALDAQCASGTCVTPFAALCGACGQHHVGDPCGPDAGCGRTLVCAATGRCRTAVAPGGACDMDTPCDVGSFCVTNGGATGMCTRLASDVDAPCDPAGFGLPICDHDRGLNCDATSHTCHLLTFATPGAACSPSTGVYCIGGGACLPAPDGGALRCVTPEADMGMCDTSTGPACATLSRCVGMANDAGTASTGTCQLARPDNCQ